MQLSKLVASGLAGAVLCSTAAAQPLEDWSIDVEAGFAERADQRFESGAYHYSAGVGTAAQPTEAQEIDLDGEAWGAEISRATGFELFGASMTIFGGYGNTELDGSGEHTYPVLSGAGSMLVSLRDLQSAPYGLAFNAGGPYTATGIAEADISIEEARLGARFRRELGSNFGLEYGAALVWREEDARSRYFQQFVYTVTATSLVDVGSQSEETGVEFQLGGDYTIVPQARLFGSVRGAYVERETNMHVAQSIDFDGFTTSDTARFNADEEEMLFGWRAGAELDVTPHMVVRFVADAVQDNAQPMFRAQSTLILNSGVATASRLDEQDSWTTRISVGLGYRF